MGPALQSITSQVGWDHLCTAREYPCGPQWLPSQETFLFSGGNMIHELSTDLCCCMAMDPDLALRGSWDGDFTMAPGDRACHVQLATPPYPLVFSFSFLYNAQATSLLIIPHMITTYLHFVEAFTAGWPCSCEPMW